MGMIEMERIEESRGEENDSLGFSKEKKYLNRLSFALLFLIFIFSFTSWLLFILWEGASHNFMAFIFSLQFRIESS
jgi:hypothetical protein